MFRELTNQMTITAVLTFGAPVSREDVRRAVEKRLLRFDRLRQRVERGGALRHPRWEPDPHFDLDHHVRAAELPAPGDKEQLQELASRLMSRPLDFSRPLWQFHVVDGYAGGGAVVAQFHHCIADGVTLVRVLLSLTDATPEAPPGGTPGEEDRADALIGVGEEGGGAGASSASTTQRLINALKRLGRGGARAARGVARGAGALGKLAWPSREPDTLLRGELGREKKAAWSEAVPLADVKAVARALGGTVNDVLLTAVTGALRRYLEGKNERVPGDLDLRAAVPVNLRPLTEAPLEMGNGFGLVFLALPVGTRAPVERLRVLRRRMDRLKSSPEAPLLLGVLAAVGATTQAFEDRIVRYLARKLTAVATNVPGPQQTRYLAGAPLETLMAWVPQAGRVGLGVSVISYDGDVRLGIATDARLVGDPDTLVEAFRREFDALVARVPGRDDGEEEETVEGEEADESETDESESGRDDGDMQPPPHEENPDRCQATTKAGEQCKLPAQDGARFCHVHRGG
jgi:WS/DGAT/MGAT family acyltransferase